VKRVKRVLAGTLRLVQAGTHHSRTGECQPGKDVTRAPRRTNPGGTELREAIAGMPKRLWISGRAAGRGAGYLVAADWAALSSERWLPGGWAAAHRSSQIIWLAVRSDPAR
jgi:hypothetical protein